MSRPAIQDRKIAREYRREAKRIAREDAEFLGSVMKPKPDWVPWKVWIWAAGFFIKIKKDGRVNRV